MGQAIAYNPCFSCNRKEMCHLCELEMHRTGSISAPKWISVEERLPTDQKDVLCYYGFDRGDGDLGYMMIGTLCYFCFDVIPHWQHADHNLVVTHWMPLPEPPKGVNNG